VHDQALTPTVSILRPFTGQRQQHVLEAIALIAQKKKAHLQHCIKQLKVHSSQGE